MARSAGVLYPVPTVDSGAVYKLSTTASTASSNTKLTVPGLGNATMQFLPEQTNSNSNGAPAAAPSTFTGGWTLNPLIPFGDPGVLAAGSATCTASVSYSQTTGSPTVTFILFVNGAEIGRATSAAVASSTSGAVLYTASVSWAQTTLPANSQVQLSVYLVVPIATNLGSTTATLNYTSAGTSVGSGLSYSTAASRSPADTGSSSDLAARAETIARKNTEASTATDAAVKTAVYVRSGPNSLAGTDTVARVLSATKPTSDSLAGTDSVKRATVGARPTTDTTATSDALARALIYGRFTDDGPSDIVRNPTKSITGVTRDQSGNILGGCTVYLLRESDGLIVRTTTSDATTGVYSFARDIADSRSYTVFDRKPSASVQGISPAGNVPS